MRQNEANSYNLYKVESFKAKRYSKKTLCILAKKGSITTLTSPKPSCLQEIINFCH